MYELKKIGKVFTSKCVGTGPSSYDKNNLPGRGLTEVEKHCLTRLSYRARARVCMCACFLCVRITAFHFIRLGTLKSVERGSNYFIESTYFARTLPPGSAALHPPPSPPRYATARVCMYRVILQVHYLLTLSIHSPTHPDSIDTVTWQ